MKLLIVLFAFAALAAADRPQPKVRWQPIDAELVERFKEWHHFKLGEIEEVLLGGANRNVIDDRLRALIESYRHVIADGNPETGMPPLDPFRHDGLTFQVEQSRVFRADVFLSNLDVRGVEQFILDNIEFRIIGLQVHFRVRLPRINYNSHYRLEARLFTFIPLPWRPSGNANIIVNDIEVGGVLVLGTSNGHLTLRSMSLDLDVGRTDVNIEGLLGNGFINSILNWILNRLTDGFVAGQQERLEEHLYEIAFNTLNDVLQNFSLADLLG